MKDTVFQRHEREFDKNLYTYPVISRRSAGLSIGINLSLRKECNFDCVYCQVDRTTYLSNSKDIQLFILEEELRALIEKTLDETIFSHPRFRDTPEKFRVLKDISLSGDGEPTSSKFFVEVTDLVLKIIKEYKTKGIFIKPIVITNASLLHRKTVKEQLLKFTQEGGGPWIKLDAGTKQEFLKIADSSISFSTILENILSFSKLTPIYLQTILYSDSGKLSFSTESMISCLQNLQEKGAQIKTMQLYTLARRTKEKNLKAVEKDVLNEVANQIQSQTGIELEIYP
ncbi:MAG: hypothetical protein H7A25_11025 [Leptospiraceae bacterium]|nr:hypothetical protein [Leptospiraceae bacterium]MCP5500428.1 hypothetical protein [Leptospiraceae bacterium]